MIRRVGKWAFVQRTPEAEKEENAVY